MPRLIKRRSSMNDLNSVPYPIAPAAKAQIIRARLARALACRSLGHVPRSWLKSNFFCMLDANGMNLFHLAARRGWINRIPTRLLTADNLKCPRTSPWSVYYWAALHKHLYQIPKHLLTLENFKERNLHDNTIYHHAALNGELYLLPNECLTRDILMKPNHHGATPLHCAAGGGHLNQIPLEFKTRENLMFKTRLGGDTAYHFAALCGNLHQISLELLDASAVLEKNIEGRTALDYSVQHCQLSTIPICTELAERITEVKAAIARERHRLVTEEMESTKQQHILRSARAWEAELARLALKRNQQLRARDA